jgi:hypothetical protein
VLALIRALDSFADHVVGAIEELACWSNRIVE